MKTVFVDSGYLVALDSKADQYHVTASKHWREFIRARPRLVTTNLVMTEVVTFFATVGCMPGPSRSATASWPAVSCG